MNLTIPHGAMLDLEDRVQRALLSGDESELDILGYGEVTLVLKMPSRDGELACKRLPLFPDEERLERYRATLREYLGALEAGGLRVAPTELWTSVRPDGRYVAYCVQRVLPAGRLAPRHLAATDERGAERFMDALLRQVTRVVTPTVGLDAQASNWIVDGDDELTYLDVTTPLLRDERGEEKLDVRLFFTSLPWALRDAVRVTMSRSIFDKFYAPSGVLLDFFGNLHKERLGARIPSLLGRANRVLDRPLGEDAIRAYYEEDAKMWALIQRLRRGDRWWQRRVRRRAYPFLLPRAIER
jgi:hypothetical protein